MPWIIDSHEDLAYNALSFQRDLLKSAAETRLLKKTARSRSTTGRLLLGWPDYQRGQVAAVFGTLFLAPRRFSSGAWETQVYRIQRRHILCTRNSLTIYLRLCDDHPDQFRLITNQKDFQEVIAPWEKTPAFLPAQDPENRGREIRGRQSPTRLVLFCCWKAQKGSAPLRIWNTGGNKAYAWLDPSGQVHVFAAGPCFQGSFLVKGWSFWILWRELGYTLDLSHMNEVSSAAGARSLCWPGSRHACQCARLAQRCRRRAPAD